MIESFIGTEGTTFDVDSPQELFTAIDILHTQTMDNMPSSCQDGLLPILEQAMRSIADLGYDIDE